MIYPLHNFYFSANRLFALQIFYFVFLVNFQGNLGVMTFAVAEENKGISTLSNLLANYVVIHASIFTEQNYLFFFLKNKKGFKDNVAEMMVHMILFKQVYPGLQYGKEQEAMLKRSFSR